MSVAVLRGVASRFADPDEAFSIGLVALAEDDGPTVGLGFRLRRRIIEDVRNNTPGPHCRVMARRGVGVSLSAPIGDGDATVGDLVAASDDTEREVLDAVALADLYRDVLRVARGIEHGPEIVAALADGATLAVAGATVGVGESRACQVRAWVRDQWFGRG